MRRVFIGLLFVFGLLFFSSAVSHNMTTMWTPVGPYTSHYIADSQGPSLTISIDPEQPAADDEPSVTITAVDADGVSTVILSYWLSTTSNWYNKTATAVDSTTFNTTLPMTDVGTNVTYKAYANDSLGNWAVSPVYSYITKQYDEVGPEIVLWYSPDEPSPGDEIIVYAGVGDPSGVSEVLLSLSFDGGAWTNESMTYDEDSMTYSRSIGALSDGQTVHFKVFASDTIGNWAVSETEVISFGDQSATDTSTAISTTSDLTSVQNIVQTIPLSFIAIGAVGVVGLIAVVVLFSKFR